MIVHHVPIKKNIKSSFKKLVDYITNPQEKQERVGNIKITNCHSSTIDWAKAEIKATQEKNSRAKGDKTYHVVISFAPGEEPCSKVLKIIEERVVASIGLSEHQRISVVHHDTDNLHIHLAINKIQPKTYRMVEPYHAYKKFAEVAVKLEQEFNLVQTNHIPKYQRSENLANNMEQHTGIESLISWMKKNCLNELIQASSWFEFNQILSKNGLVIKGRANGFVFCTANNLMVKASSISRELSKSKLEKHLGPFSLEGSVTNKAKATYKLNPKNKGKVSMDLYEQYEAGKQNDSIVTSEKLRLLSLKKKRLFDKALKKSKLKRLAMKLMNSSRASKKVIHALINWQYEKEANKIKKQCSVEREKILVGVRNVRWADWLQRKAQEGNTDALDVLRQKAQKSHAKYGLKGQDPQSTTIDTERLDSVTKNGTVIYKMGECTVKDDGKQLNISRGISLDDLNDVILMAKKRYGRCITVNGNELFKKTVARVAVRNRLDVTFSDKTLEKFRQELTKELENINERKRQHGNGDRKRTGRGNEAPRRGSPRGSGKRRAGATQPHPNRFRDSASPEGQDSLRNMSQLNVVEFPRRREVLLPDNAHDKLEREGAKPDNKVRRSIFGLKKSIKKRLE